MMLMIIGVKLHLNELNFALTNIFILLSSFFIVSKFRLFCYFYEKNQLTNSF